LDCSQLLALHRTATLRHDSLGQETLLNLLLRNHLAFNLYDQVLRCCMHCTFHRRSTHRYTSRTARPAWSAGAADFHR
jgi:hypothetical protein